MSPNPQLASPGGSTYDSNSIGLHVGDGTWDNGRDDFLLPNLVGLPFSVMRYNGMGNRFAGLPEYHQLIVGHGVIAALTFLFIVPTAIMTARFYFRNPFLALRIHMWLQIITMFLSTVVLILGWFAVGPSRSLTNPHHGIGVAIYTLVLFQAMYGAWVRHHERKKVRNYTPKKLMLHQWIGRATALLAIVQVALGLTLYGSPKSLFVLYTLWVFFLLFIYFVLTYRSQFRRIDDDQSYTDSQTDITGGGGGDRRRGLLGRIAPWALAGGAAAGIAALMSRRNRRSESRDRVDRITEVTGHTRRTSRPGSESFIEEKYTEDGRRTHTWRDRLLGATAGIGLFEGARRMFGGRQRDEEDSDVSFDRPTQSGIGTETDIRRVEEGRPPTSSAADQTRRTENNPSVPVAAASPSRRSVLRARRSGGSVYSYDSALSHNSPGRDKRRNQTLRDGIAALGVTGYIRHKLNQRRDRREDQRVSEVHDRDRQEERIARMNSTKRRYTGDGTPNRVRRYNSLSESELSPISGSNPSLSRHSLPRPVRGGGAGSRRDVVSNPNVPTPPPFTHATPQPSPAPPQDRHRLRDAAVPLAAGAAGVAAGAALGAAAANRRASSRRRESVGDQASPPVSLKMKMHNDGRHVTLRRLDPTEAAAERERRRRDRTSSFSSVGGSGDEHWRRTERRQTAEASDKQQQNVIPGPPPGPPPVVGNTPLPQEVISNLPPPPPIPAASGLDGSPGSGAGYDSSAVGSRAEIGRRRRRIERARVEQERKGNRVDFT